MTTKISLKSAAVSNQQPMIPITKFIPKEKFHRWIVSRDFSADFPLDVPRQLSTEEQNSPMFSIRCKLARGYLAILLETGSFVLDVSSKNQTFRTGLFKMNSEGTQIIKKLQSLEIHDKAGVQKVLQEVHGNFEAFKAACGEKPVKALKSFGDLPDLWGLSFATICGHEAEKNCPQVFAKLSFASPTMTVHEAFLQEFLRWMLKQTLSEPSMDQLLQFWGALSEKKKVDKSGWMNCISKHEQFPAVKEGLLEFQSLYDSYQNHLLGVFTLQDLSLSHLAKKRESIGSAQLLAGYQLWNRNFNKLLREQNSILANISHGAATFSDVSCATSKRPFRNEAAHKEKFKKNFGTENDKKFVRLCKHLSQSWQRKIGWIEEEVFLLKTSSQSASLIELTLLSAMEQMGKLLDEVAVAGNEMLDQTIVYLEGGVSFNEKYSQKKNKDEPFVFECPPPELHEQLKVAIQMTRRVLSECNALLGSLQFFSRYLINLMRQDIVPPTIGTPSDSKDSKQPATATTSTNPTLRPPSPKLLSREAFRRRLAYETLALTDLLDIDEIAPPTAPKAPPLKKASPPKPTAAPELVSTKTLPPPATTELSTKELDLQLERVLSTKSIVIGSVSPFVLALTQALYPTTRTAEAQEAADHLFLATQSLEVIAECLARKKPELLGSAYRAFLLDMAIALEQTLKLNNLSTEHNLVKLAENSALTLTAAQHAFLDQHAQATLWARYPAASTAFFGNDALPDALRTLNQLSNSVPSTFVSELFTAYRQLLSIAVTPELMKTPSVQKFLTHLDQLEKALVVPSEKTTPKKPTPSQTQLTQALSLVHYAQTQDDDPTVPLQEISHYLAWISQGQELQKQLTAPELRFWHLRNLLDVEKLFKHLYTADALLHDVGSIRRHSLPLFATALDGIRNLKPHLALLRSINFKIGHHYHTRAPLKAYPALLRDCQGVTQGFTSVEKEEDRAFPNVDEALKLFVKQLPFTLDKLRRVEEDLAREARQVVVKG